jgi:beta-lactamase superfamily II metal-dependent hydrolase
MAETNGLFDEYALRARLAPTLVVVVIPVMGFLCWLPTFSTTQLTLAAALSTVLVAIFSQIGRDQGKALQPKLYAAWGGQPSVQLLRHRPRLLAKETRERYRHKLESLTPPVRLPSEIEEIADPDGADVRYDSLCLFLRDTTRSKSAYPLVFAENVNYGFRRNLLGMKRAGIALTLAGAVSAVLATILGMKPDGFDLPPVPAVAAVLNAVLLSWWIVRINSEWVRLRRTIGRCMRLDSGGNVATEVHARGSVKGVMMSNVAQDVLWPTDSEVLIRVGMLYVGQGDSSVVLVKDGDGYKTALIDINRDNEGNNGINVPKLMKDLLADQDGRLDLFVNTHPHKDHLDDITELNKQVDIHEIWESGHVPGADDKASYDELQAVIKKVKKKHGDDAVTEILGSKTAIPFGDAEIYILSPAEHVKDDISDEDDAGHRRRIHEHCAVLRFGKDSTWVLFTGDADRTAWEEHITDYHKKRLPSQIRI